MNNRNGAKIINIRDLGKLTYEIPESLIRAAGLLKGKINPVKYQRKVRNEWEQRLKRLVKPIAAIKNAR